MVMVPAFARWSGAPESGSPGFGRKKLRTLLAKEGWEPDSIDNPVLMLSELISNVVLHAHTRFSVDAAVLRGRLRVDVRDRSALPPTVQEAPGDIGIRGLAIVAKLADTWGYTTVEGGKSVWFTATRTHWALIGL